MVSLARRPPAAAVRGPTWVLVLAAFLFGVTVASAVFVGVWRHEASRAKAADSEAHVRAAALEEANDRLARSRARVRRTETQLQRVRADARRQAKQLAGVAAAGKPVVAEAGRLDSAAQQLAAESAALGDSAAKVANAVGALGVYLRQTRPAQIDPAFVDAQLSYLEQAVASLRSRSEQLRAGAGSVAERRKRLAGGVAKLERLAGASKS